MSILSALKQQNSSIDDLAKLPQAMIMQMAQKKQISEDMLAPILARKAEMMDAVARSRSLQQPTGQPSVMEQVMAKNIQAENPANTMPQAPEEVGVGQIPVPERQYAGGGIIAFARGDLIDLDEEDDDNDILAEYAQAMAEGERAGEAGIPSTMPRSGNADMRSADPESDQARKYNVGNLRPSGFTYPGQIGLSKGKFAMFDSPESGLAALQHDIAVKLNRGLDTPEKFISVYAPAEDKNNTNVYSKNIADMLGIGTRDRIPNTPEAKQLLANAIIRQEGAHKATAAFAQGGDVLHFAEGGLKEAQAQRDAALKALSTNMPDVPEDFKGNLTDYLSDPERAAAYERNQLDREIARKAILYNNPLPSLNRDILNPAASMNNPAPEPVVKKPTVETKKPDVPVVPASTAPSNQDWQNFDQAQALFEAENKNKVKKAEIPVAKGRFESFLDEVAQDRKDFATQRTQDKNMALLAAGLGMLGGTSQYAFENIGKGGLAGVQYLSEANKQRIAEKSGLDKSQVAALRYQDLADIAKGGRESSLGIRSAELFEKQRSHNMTALNQLEKNSLAKATAALKSQGLLGTDLNDPQTQQMLNDWVQKDLANNKAYNKIYQDTFGFNYDVSPQTSGGNNVIRFDKKGNPIK